MLNRLFFSRLHCEHAGSSRDEKFIVPSRGVSICSVGSHQSSHWSKHSNDRRHGKLRKEEKSYCDNNLALISPSRSVDNLTPISNPLRLHRHDRYYHNDESHGADLKLLVETSRKKTSNHRRTKTNYDSHIRSNHRDLSTSRSRSQSRTNRDRSRSRSRSRSSCRGTRQRDRHYNQLRSNHQRNRCQRQAPRVHSDLPLEWWEREEGCREAKLDHMDIVDRVFDSRARLVYLTTLWHADTVLEPNMFPCMLLCVASYYI